jgi:rubrerythrin
MPTGLAEKPPLESTAAALEAVYNWNYEPEIDQLRTLYANALERQWIAVRDLDWQRGVDRDAFSRSVSLAGIPIQQTDFWQTLDPELRWEISRRTSAFLLSNFLHGEQGALMVAAQLVNAVPHMDAKFYAATQTLDEARHVEVFAAYIRLLDEVHPIMPSLKNLLDETLGRESWMHKAVGMQIVIEGLALYVFREMRNTTEEPLLKQLLTYVSRDEARHTGYGIKYLSHVRAELSPAEVAELEDFAFEAARKLVDSRQGPTLRRSVLEIWRQAGLDPEYALGELAREREKLDARGGAAGPIRGFVIPTLRSIGLFSPRIESHFREMFAANFGEERAARLNLRSDLPADLDAWVESSA